MLFKIQWHLTHLIIRKMHPNYFGNIQCYALSSENANWLSLYLETQTTKIFSHFSNTKSRVHFCLSISVWQFWTSQLSVERSIMMSSTYSADNCQQISVKRTIEKFERSVIRSKANTQIIHSKNYRSIDWRICSNNPSITWAITAGQIN